MPDGLDKLMNATGKVLEVAPDVYTDVLQPAAKETGKTFSLIPRIINAALVPLECWIEQRQYRLDETKKLLVQKLEHVGEDKIITPDPYVAVPALQAISYSMDSDELRNLYANLLAKAMNIDTKDTIHPSFVETIKQLSPLDAAYFKHIAKLPLRPIIEVRVFNSQNFFYPFKILCNTFSSDFKNSFQLSIDNLSRLGLINIPQDIFYGDESIYSELISVYKDMYPLEKIIQTLPDATRIEYDKQRIDLTKYGSSFYNSCVI